MNRRTKLLNKLCAVLILFAICISDFLFVGTKLISYAIDNVKTNIYNVDFLAYFLDENGEKVDKVQKAIDDEEIYLYVDIEVKNEGYFNGTINLENNNFDLKNDIKSKEVSKISGNQVTLKQINAGNTVTIKLPIKANTENKIKEEDLHKRTKVVLNGEYVNSKNAESKNYTNVNGSTDVEVDFKSSTNAQAELNAKVLTNSSYIIDNEEKQIVQLLIGSKITNNNYPVKNTELNLNVLPNVETVKVHTKSTDATNSKLKFDETNYTYNKETNNLKINVANDDRNEVYWNKNSIDVFVVTYVFPKDENILNKELTINSTINTYDERILTASKNLILDNKVDGIISYSVKNSEDSIYKGNLYIGEPREYKENAKISIDYVGIAQKISLKSNQDIYLNNTDGITANILYKQTKINKEEFIKIFGDEGFITIKNNDGTIIANVNKNTIQDEQGNFVIDYPSNAKNVEFLTSKPINVGTLNLENTKQILNNEYSREDVNTFTLIKSNFIGNYNEKQNGTIESKIELKNTTTKAKLELNTKKLTAEKTNENVKIKVVLPNNNEALDVFSNPEVKIKFPKQVTNLSAKCKILYGNGLVLGDATIQNVDGNNEIYIKLNGTQNSYNPQNIEGTVIAIYANIDLDKNTTTSIEDITLNYTNEYACSLENNGEEKAQVKIVEVPKQEPVVKQETKQEVKPQEQDKPTMQETKESGGIKMTLNASVGGEEISNGAEVKAGEIIVYNIKLENNNETDLEGLTLNATVPENTTLLEVDSTYPKYNEEDGTRSTEDPLFITKEDKQIKKDNITLKANATEEYSYMVQVNSKITNATEIASNISINNSNIDEKIVFKNTVVAANLELSLKPLYRAPKDELSFGYSYMYKLDITNNTDTVQENVQVTLNKNELVDFSKIEYYKNEDLIVVKDTSFTIDSILANDSIGIVIYAGIKEFSKELNKTKMYLTAKDNKNNIYRSNLLTDNVGGVLANISLKSEATTSSNNKNIKNGDVVNYKITVKNTGNQKAEKLSIEDNFSEFLELEEVKLNNEPYEYFLYENNEENGAAYSKIVIEKALEAGEETVVDIKAKAKENDTENIVEVLNQAQVFNEVKLAETEKDTFYLQVTKQEEQQDSSSESDNEGDEENSSDEEVEDNSNEDNSNEDEDGDNSLESYDENNEENSSDISDEENEENISDENEDGEESQSTNSNRISGVAWLDKNKDGQRDSDEELLSDINITLLNVDKNETEQTETDEDGVYEFVEVENGRYVVIFEYDDETYSLTKYQADGVDRAQNSDAEMVQLKIDGDNSTVAATDTLTLNNSNLEHVDIGLVEATTFDLELRKVISKVTVSNTQGNQVKEYDDKNLAKVEVKAKYLKGTTVVVEYKIQVTNKGEIPGYAKSIIDYKPVDWNFNSSLNTDWYQSENELYNDSLEDTLIKPGETKEVKLILTKQMTETNTGLTNNIAEIEESENSQDIEDINSTPGNKNKSENDLGSADVIISVGTGAAFRFAFITLLTIVIIATLGYIISKKILDKNMNF